MGQDPIVESRLSRVLRYLGFGFLGLVIGALLGLIGGGFGPGLYYQLTDPEVLKDGQWGMILLMTLPVGIGIGAAAGCVVACLLVARARRKRHSI